MGGGIIVGLLDILLFLKLLNRFRPRAAAKDSRLGMNPNEWREFLHNWQNEVLQCSKYVEDFQVFSWFPELANGPQIKEGNEEDVLNLEARLSTKLPSTFKNFLLAVDGWNHITMFLKFLPAKDVDWFYNTDKEWVDIWNEDSEDFDIPDDEYFVYGEEQDPINIRREYMKSCLKISSDSDGYVFLLNPEIQSGNDEWEAWSFGAKYPGAVRYKCFEELMISEYKTAIEDTKYMGVS